MQIYKICIWMDIPSHYQSALFTALQHHNEVNLVVRYFHGVEGIRKDEGWAADHDHNSYESCVAGYHSPRAMLETIVDWRDRIHVISINFNANLIKLFCREHVKWIHWSEMSGIRLANLLGFRMGLYHLLNPIVLKCKYKEGLLIKNHALCVLGQGKLAKNSFEQMGIPRNMIHDLYYSPAPLERMKPCQQIIDFASDRKVFLFVGALCRRKGVDLLLKAFASLKTDDWCLVMCGLDKENGLYYAMAERLGIVDKVLFLGAYPVEEIATVYRASDVLVLSSRFDGWGTVLNEAASLGLAIIGTEMCGAAWHVISDGENGFRVKEDSVLSLKKALKTYTENPGQVQIHGQKAKSIFKRQFSPGKNADRLVQVIKRIMS